MFAGNSAVTCVNARQLVLICLAVCIFKRSVLWAGRQAVCIFKRSVLWSGRQAVCIYKRSVYCERGVRQSVSSRGVYCERGVRQSVSSRGVYCERRVKQSVSSRRVYIVSGVWSVLIFKRSVLWAARQTVCIFKSVLWAARQAVCIFKRSVYFERRVMLSVSSRGVYIVSGAWSVCGQCNGVLRWCYCTNVAQFCDKVHVAVLILTVDGAKYSIFQVPNSKVTNKRLECFLLYTCSQYLEYTLIK